MSKQLRVTVFLKQALFLICAAPLAAMAQEWPNKTITFVVPFPAGGGTDAFARPLAAQLTEQLGKQFIIDNRGGAGGTVGASVAAKAAPDGYTWFIGASHHTIAPSMYKNLDYNIEKSFIPVAMIANTARTSLPKAFSFIATTSQRRLRAKPRTAPNDQAMFANCGELKFRTIPATELASARSKNQ
jgi:tripartite-type tricarboxylate transporter receptor subunit TctC